LDVNILYLRYHDRSEAQCGNLVDERLFRYVNCYFILLLLTCTVAV